jgi:uncharacterized small protein (DUF1192 family)
MAHHPPKKKTRVVQKESFEDKKDFFSCDDDAEKVIAALEAEIERVRSELKKEKDMGKQPSPARRRTFSRPTRHGQESFSAGRRPGSHSARLWGSVP